MGGPPFACLFHHTFFIFEHRLESGAKKSRWCPLEETEPNRTESNRNKKNHIHYHTHTNNKLELITGKSGELKVYLCCLEMHLYLFLDVRAQSCSGKDAFLKWWYNICTSFSFTRLMKTALPLIDSFLISLSIALAGSSLGPPYRVTGAGLALYPRPISHSARMYGSSYRFLMQVWCHVKICLAVLGTMAHDSRGT